MDGVMDFIAPDDDLFLFGTGIDEKRIGPGEFRNQVERDWSQTEALAFNFNLAVGQGDTLMTEILSDLSSTSLALATKANLYAFFDSIRYSSEAMVEEWAHGFSWQTSVAHPWFNGVLCRQPPVANATQAVAETVAYFRSHDVDTFTWWLTPSLKPGAWSQHLLAQGFEYDDNTPGMALALADLPPAAEMPFTIRPIEDSETLAVWARTFVQGFEMPEGMTGAFLALMESLGTDLPLRHYLGLANGEPLATSSLFLGAGVAGIYNVATLPAARGQGVGSAMTLAPLYEAREMGYRAGVLQSSKMGYSVYQRLGFETVCQMDHFSRRVQGSQVDG